MNRSNRHARWWRMSLPLLAAVFAACQAASPTIPPTPTAAPTISVLPTATATSSTAATPTSEATATLLPSPTATTEATASGTCAQRTLAGLSLDQRVGQLFLLAIEGTTAPTSEERSAIETYHLGSIWIKNNRTDGVAGIAALAASVQDLAPGATAGVPFFVAADQEGGEVQRLSGPGFSTIPPATQQGLLAASALQADAQVWAGQLRAAGVNLNFAPVMDTVPPDLVATNAPIGQLQREYGNDPATVSTHGVAVLRGMNGAGVATTIKHFPGLGRVAGNTDLTSGVVDSVTTMSDPFLTPFRAGISAGVPFVMVSLATYTQIDPNHLAVFSPTVMRTLLRGRLGFRGVVMSDALGGTQAVASIDPGTRAVDFIAAGGDFIVVDGVTRAAPMAQALVARAGADPAFRALVDASALRILAEKARFGVLTCG